MGVQVAVLLFFALVVVAVLLAAALLAVIVQVKEVVLELSLLLEFMVKFLGCHIVSLVVAVIVIALADLFINLVSLLALLPLQLLLLNPLHPVQVGLLRFDPAALVADNVFVVELGDGLDFLHGRVREEGLLAILGLIAVSELHMNFDFLQRIAVAI